MADGFMEEDKRRGASALLFGCLIGLVYSDGSFKGTKANRPKPYNIWDSNKLIQPLYKEST